MINCAYLLLAFSLFATHDRVVQGCWSNTYASTPSRSLESAFNKYSSGCQCGIPFDNNCAHYVSNALIKAGFSEIDGGTGANMRNRNGFIVCRAGRPIRAKEVRDWAARKFTEYTKDNLPSGTKYCVVYQGGSTYYGGHVAIAKISGRRMVASKGTGWYGNWPQQRYFCQ